jgi:transposase
LSTVQRVWVGVDVGKAHHWAVAVDHEGRRLLSRKVANDEEAILAMIAAVCELAGEVRWAVDISSRLSALLLALLMSHGQQVVYVPGRTVNRMAGAFAGEGKTDAKDAQVIADVARMRSGFRLLTTSPEMIHELALLTSCRRDLVSYRVRMINRLRELLVGICPALEREFEYKSRAGLVLLTGFQTPAALRRIGVKRLTDWLVRRKVRSAADIAERAVMAGRAQQTILPGQARAARLVADLAQQILDLDERLKQLDAEITEVLAGDETAEIIQSMPGMGPLLTAELIARTGDLSSYRNAGHLAAHAGIAPVPNDSGRRLNNLHRPTHYDRRLCRIFYLSAQTAMSRPGPSQEYYHRKRDEGKSHVQAVLSLARRRVDVLWAMSRDRRRYTAVPPTMAA